MKELLLVWCGYNAIEFKELTRYQYRLSRDKIVCDIYPVNMRFHIIKHIEPLMIQQRGNIGEIEIFLESIFNY